MGRFFTRLLILSVLIEVLVLTYAMRSSADCKEELESINTKSKGVITDEMRRYNAYAEIYSRLREFKDGSLLHIGVFPLKSFNSQKPALDERETLFKELEPLGLKIEKDNGLLDVEKVSGYDQGYEINSRVEFRYGISLKITSKAEADKFMVFLDADSKKRGISSVNTRGFYFYKTPDVFLLSNEGQFRKLHALVTEAGRGRGKNRFILIPNYPGMNSKEAQIHLSAELASNDVLGAPLKSVPFNLAAFQLGVQVEVSTDQTAHNLLMFLYENSKKTTVDQIVYQVVLP